MSGNTLRIKHVNYVINKLFNNDELSLYGLEQAKLFDIESDLTEKEELEAKSSLMLPPIRVYHILKLYIDKISTRSLLYLISFLDYLITEIIISSMTICEIRNKIKVTDNHILISFDLDEELHNFIINNNIIMLTDSLYVPISSKSINKTNYLEKKLTSSLILNPNSFNYNLKQIYSDKFPFLLTLDAKRVCQQVCENQIIKWIDQAMRLRDYESRQTLTLFDLLVTSHDVLFVNDWLSSFKYSTISHEDVINILTDDINIETTSNDFITKLALHHHNPQMTPDAKTLLVLSCIYMGYMIINETYKIALLTKKNDVVKVKLTVEQIRKTLAMKNYWLVIC